MAFGRFSNARGRRDEMNPVRLFFTAVFSAALAIFIIGCSDHDDHGHSHDDIDGHHHHSHQERPEDPGHTHEHQDKEPEHRHDETDDHGHSHEQEADDAVHQHKSPGTVLLQEEEIERFGIETEPAGGGMLNLSRQLQGRIVLNADRTVHIVPRVTGIVREVRNSLGDRVEEGEVLAVIESAELADLKALYLGALERYDIAGEAFRREKDLRDGGISSESEYLQAKKEFTESKIERRSSRQKLLALGFDGDYLKKLPLNPGTAFTRYAIRAPFSGIIIRKHITTGEAVAEDTGIFTITDLDTLWADLQVFPSDAEFLEVGQELEICSDTGEAPVRGRITLFNPVIDSDSRRSLARAVLDNRAGDLIPGAFVTARIMEGTIHADVILGRDVIHEIDGSAFVFVRNHEGFEARRVKIGRSGGEYAEIAEGLRQGEAVAVKNSFMLKAELVSSERGAHAGHGHSH
ncbi:MAG: efflux RND transporter periplasmic adaptor subunit [Candidatus Latescibacteria bacterium]|nr:efflux RND transporter periplasmic adaptor subunit [bacterium]MBD3424192.1 efflux RND transporter periplasmic adaptor subunit [Candidatus Latescibacterota bacterium]